MANVVVDEDHLEAYDGSGVRTFFVDPGTGDVTFTGTITGGTFQTADPDTAVEDDRWVRISNDVQDAVQFMRQPAVGSPVVDAAMTYTGAGLILETAAGTAQSIQIVPDGEFNVDTTDGDIIISALGHAITFHSDEFGIFGSSTTQPSDPGNHVTLSGTDSDGTARTKVNLILQALRDVGIIG